MIEATHASPEALDRFRRRALVVGVVFLLPCIAGWFFSPGQFFHSYLLAYIFWVAIALGCLAILMLQHVTGGAWGLVIRRLLESATRTIPLMALLFLPLALGMRVLYVWARPEEVSREAILQHKSFYLTVPFFWLRAAFYFLVWYTLARFLNKWSLEQDRAAQPRIARRLQALSAPGLVLFGLTATFASVDWVMSLEPEWFSTIFGLLFIAGQGLSAMAFVIAAVVILAKQKPLSQVISPGHLHDLGKLLLAFVMIWAYFAFSQYLIIWSGNLPEEISWYARRLGAGWQWVGLALVVFHFALPFLLLLSRDFKRRASLLGRLAAAVIVMRLVDLFWLIAPGFRPESIGVHWMDLAAPVGLGGIWLAFFAGQLKQRPLLPIGDPNLEQALSRGEH